MTIRIAFLLIISFYSANLLSSDKVITMGYKAVEREPLMAAAPDNNGLYFELYSIALKRIGYTLKVIRGPKKRIYKNLKNGIIDFYPGASLSAKRATFAFYFKNGLQAGHAGLSLPELPEITHLSQLDGLLLKQLGGHDFLQGIEGVSVKEVPELTIEKAIQIIKTRRASLFIYDKSSLEYYIKKHQVEGVKIHPNAYKGVEPMYLAFSRNSQYFSGHKNNNYKPDMLLSLENYPYTISTDSVAYQFGQALIKMENNGETQKIYNKFYK